MAAADEATRRRREHVRRYIRGRGLRDARVLRVMEKVPREVFIDDVSLETAYGDHPVPIGCGQTISQPYMVAWMTAVLGLGQSDRVLEIGTGSGYQTAVLASLVDEVYTVEYYAALSDRARLTLEALGFTNVHFKVGDGSVGWPRGAPYDAVCVTAGAPDVPPSLQQQLADGGRLVIPVGNRFIQELVLVTRNGDRFQRRELGGCRFVPLQGEEGWGRKGP